MVEPGRSPFLAALLALTFTPACAAPPPATPGARATRSGPPSTVLLAAASGSVPASPYDFRIPDEAFDQDPRAVTGEEAALDLEVAARAFSEAYVGVDGASRVPSPAEIAWAHDALATRPRWEPEDLAKALLRLFRRPDGHLAFGWDGRSPARLSAWPHDTPITVGDPLAPADEGSAAPSLVDRATAPAPGAVVALVRGAVPRLVVRTFDSAAAQELERLPAIARRLRELPAFVVDLRGNGGGNFRYAERFLLELTDAPLRGLDQRELVSVAALEGRANSARRHLALGEVPAGAEGVFRAHIDALEAAADAMRAAGEGPRERVVEGAVEQGRAPGPLRGHAVILVDGGCASACEMAVALARQIHGVVIAGSPTRGSMAAGELALFRLPRSGIAVWMGTRAYRDPSGGFAETRGFLPDVRLAGDEASALAQAEALALGLHGGALAARVEVSTPSRVSWKR